MTMDLGMILYVLYVVAVFLAITICSGFMFVLYVVYREVVWEWVWRIIDRVFYGALDIMMGKHETIRGDDVI